MNVTPIKKESISLSPKSLEEAMRFADMLASSSIVPKDYLGKPGNCLVAIQWGYEIGLQPMQAMQSIAVINGRPSLWGDAMLALVKAHPAFEWIKESADANGATCTVKRRGEPEVSQTFTVEDAKRAGLYGKAGPWQQYPKRMLQMRARGFALRDAFPDALRGVISAEEAHDAPPEKDMGAAEVVQPAEKPATRTEAIKGKLLGEKTSVTLQQVTEAILNAGTVSELQATADMAAKLTKEGDKKSARAAYAHRAHQLKQDQPDAQDEALRCVEQTGKVDQETGEFFPSPDEEAAIREREMREAAGE